jgi:hypothetical protein
MASAAVLGELGGQSFLQGGTKLLTAKNAKKSAKGPKKSARKLINLRWTQ